MSTIIRFSARSLAEPASSAARRRSSSPNRPRGRVPFIGRIVTRPPERSKNSSGDSDSTAHPEPSSNAAYGASPGASSAERSSSQALPPPSEKLP